MKTNECFCNGTGEFYGAYCKCEAGKEKIRRDRIFMEMTFDQRINDVPRYGGYSGLLGREDE